MRTFRLLLSLLFLFFFLSGVALSQDTGQLTGTVKDPSGANVAKAQVTVSNSEKGINRVTETNNDGEYVVGGLSGGSYNLTVNAPGFKTYQAKGIALRVAQKARADANLSVGGTSSEVTVEGGTIGQVETQSSDLSGVITGKEISQLQLNGRNFTQLATLTPGVNNQSGQDEGTVGINGNVAFSINGGRTEYNNWELDGGDNMDNGSNSSLNVYPSIDAIAEFKVLTSNYGAQYGRSGSSTVEVETKSGTSQFHGDAYEFVRNQAFNARNYFQSTVPQYNKNDYGYTIGGPIFIPNHYNTNKQKTFFFWSQEWRVERVPGQVFNTPVPSNAERSGDFSDLCPNQTTGSFADCPINPATGSYFPNNQVPVSTTGAALLPLIPLPNGGVPGAELYNASPSQPTNWREELIRLDQNFGSKLRAMFRYTHDSWNTVTPVGVYSGSYFPTVQTNYVGPAVSVVARLNWNPTSSLVNEFVASYTTDHITFTSTGTPNPNAWQRPANLPMGAFFNNGFGGKLPTIQLIGSAAYGGGFYQDPNGEWPEGPYNSNPTYTYRDNVSKIIGRHNMQFGAYFVAAQKNELSSQFVNGYLTFNTSATAVTTGNSFADLLMGQVASYQQASTNLKFYNRYKIFEPYFQDDWRITPKLTLNLGLRISMFGTYREKYNHAYNWTPSAYSAATAPQIDTTGSVTGVQGALIPGTGNPYNGLVQCGVNGVPAGCMSGHLFNPAPRVGFAYDLFGNGLTAIRGGYGIFFEHTNGNEANTESLEGQSSPLIQNVTQYNVSGYPNLGGVGLLSPLNFVSIPTQATWPYIQQWHFDIQQQAFKDTVLTFSYVGSKGTHLNRQDDLNQLYPVPASQNPYLPGEPIGGINNSSPDCATMTTPSGVPVTGIAAINLGVACGNDPNPNRPFYGAGTITQLANAASSSYNAFQFSARRNVGTLQLSLAYTWSHSIDDSSDRYDSSFVNTYNPASNRASSSFDIRQMFNLGWVYDLPFFKNPGLANKLLGGWQYSGIVTSQTGTPYSPTNAANYPDNAGVGNSVGTGSYPDRIGDPLSFIPNVPLSGYGPLNGNPGAFAAPQGLTFGNAGRNSLRNPGYTNFNMALYKNFKVRERASFEFRAEAYNIFNHTEWGPLGGSGGSAAYNGFSSNTYAMSCYAGQNNSAGDPSCLGSANFLYIGITHPARILQLGLKFIF
jgi:hypothetical protein